MKKSVILGAIVTSFLLSSCSLFKSYSTDSKSVDVYLVDSAIAQDKNIEQCKLGTISPLFISGEQYVPYFSLRQYASLYGPYFESDVKSEVSSEGSTSTWTIYRGNQLYFYAMISPLTKTIMMAGSISSVLSSDSNPSDYTMISKYTTFKDSTVRLSEDNYATYYFSGYSFKSFSKDGERFYPLGLLDNAFCDSSNLYHFYNYKAIYATWDVENYSKQFKIDSGFGRKTSVNQQMENVTNGLSIPDYLIDYNASCFLFVLDNFYGLKSYYGIKSMKEYLNNKGIYNGLFQTNGAKRGDAYAIALASFDDHHTGLISANNAWGEGSVKAIGGERVIKRQYQDNKLTAIKNEKFPPSIPYLISNDRKTALFYFDAFNLGTTEQVMNSDGSIKADAYKYDSFYNVLYYLNLFKQDHIENVIIDVSTNGGGVIGVMLKILALISKDNKGVVSLLYEDTDVVNISECSVDVNMDGKYTADETFGNTFNFYMLTSDCSFSCGNAFPCYAQKMGIKILGEKSGGGECAVGVHYMPNSEYVYHSSNIHLGYYDDAKNEFTGFEKGATPDVSLVPSGKKGFSEYKGDGVVYNIPSNLYDVNYLSTLLN